MSEIRDTAAARAVLSDFAAMAEQIRAAASLAGMRFRQSEDAGRMTQGARALLGSVVVHTGEMYAAAVMEAGKQVLRTLCPEQAEGAMVAELAALDIEAEITRATEAAQIDMAIIEAGIDPFTKGGE